MKIKDLLVLFKGSRFSETDEIMSFIIDLLGKFELALTWDNEHLLIPSLLPSESMLKFTNQDIRVPIISRPKILADQQLKPISNSASCVTLKPSNNEYSSLSLLYSSVKLSNSYSQSTLASKFNLEFSYECKPVDSGSSTSSVRRLYCLSYLPSGFFSRLITRILCDNIIKKCLLELIDIEFGDVEGANSLIDFICQEAEWRCWQTGVELKYLDFTLIRVKELIQDPLIDFNSSKKISNRAEVFLAMPVLYRDCENEFKLKSANKQCSFVECYASFRDHQIVKSKKNSTSTANESKETMSTLLKIICHRQISIKIFALVIEIIDSLLEDWYPDLGTRFMQDSKGDYLVTRLAPCSDCVKVAKGKIIERKSSLDSTFSFLSPDEISNFMSINDKFKIETSDNVSFSVDDLDNRLNESCNESDEERIKVNKFFIIEFKNFIK